MLQSLDEVYPSPMITAQPDSSSSHESNSSFGPVFAVLAVIVVISTVACVLGRLCSRRYHRAKEAAGCPPKGSKQRSHGGGNGGLGPKEWQKPRYNTRDGDIEFGFDKKISSGKGAKNGGGGQAKPQQHDNGRHKQEARFADNV